MTQYRCYFTDEDGLQIGWRAFERLNTEDATAHAIGLLVAYPDSRNVEVWEGPIMIFRYDLPAMPSPADLRLLCYRALAAAEIEIDMDIKHALAVRAAELAQKAEALERSAN